MNIIKLIKIYLIKLFNYKSLRFFKNNSKKFMIKNNILIPIIEHKFKKNYLV